LQRRGGRQDELEELVAQLLAGEAEGDGRLEIARLRAAVEATAAEAEGGDVVAGSDLLGDGVGELHFAAGPRLDPLEVLEHAGREDVAADHREVRRRIGLLRLLDHPADRHGGARGGADVEDAVGGHARGRDLHGGDHVAAGFGIGLDHLLEAGLLGVDHVVGQDHREGLVADQAAGAPHRMAEAATLLLADIGDMAARHVGLAQQVDERVLPAVAQRLL
jgi:hypothetical protein